MQNWALGGIADSKRMGAENSSYTLKNADIHTDLGLLQCHQGLEDDGTGTKPDTDLVAIIHTNVNKTYFFGTGGDVWVRDSSAVYSLLGSIPVGTAYGKIYDAKEFNGDLYYTMAERVGKYTPNASWNNSTSDGTQNNFKNIDFSVFQPLKVVQNDLYVGNTNKIGKITPDEVAGGDITNALTLDSSFTVESLGDITRYLIIGTRIVATDPTKFIGFSRIFKWDLISNTFSSEQEIKEFGISAFMEYNGSLLFNAGQDGNLYSYDGSFAQRFRRIPNSIENDTSVKINASSSLNGVTLIGVTREGRAGVYSLGSYDAKYSAVFNLPFSIENEDDTITIGAVAWAGTDLLVSYRIGDVTQYLKKVSTDLATLETESLIMSQYDSKGRKVVPSPIVRYDSYPSGTNIQLYASVNRGSYEEITLDKTVENKLTSRAIQNAREIQYKLVLTPNGTSTPKIEYYG